MDNHISAQVRQEKNAAGKNLPDMRFKAGPVVATIWLNKAVRPNGEESSFNTVSLERSYKDKSGEWQKTSSLRINDLPKAALALNKAYEYIVLNGGDAAA